MLGSLLFWYIVGVTTLCSGAVVFLYHIARKEQAEFYEIDNISHILHKQKKCKKEICPYCNNRIVYVKD